MKIKFYENCPACHGNGLEPMADKYTDTIYGYQTCRLCKERAKVQEEFKQIKERVNE